MDFETALKLKVLGLFQSHKTGSRYYITPDYVVRAENLAYVEDVQGAMVDWTPFAYIPTVDDILAFLADDFGEVRALSDGYCAYARRPFDESDQVLRALGSSPLQALAELAIKVKAYGKEETPAI